MRAGWFIKGSAGRVMVGRTCVHGLLFFALAAVFGSVGCATQTPGPARSSESRLSSAQVSATEKTAVIRAGQGITFRTVDGGIVDGREVVVEEGTRSIRFRVRRSLRELKDDRLTDIYSVGSCRIRLATQPGSRYEVISKPFLTRRLQYDKESGPKGEEREIVGVTIRVRDEVAGDEWLAPAKACELRLDCSRLNRESFRAGDECTVDRSSRRRR